MIVENFPLASLIKMKLSTNGNLKNDKAVNEKNVPFLPLKLTAT